MQVLSDASKRTRLSAMASETAGPGSPAQVEVDVGFEDVPDRSRASPPGPCQRAQEGSGAGQNPCEVLGSFANLFGLRMGSFLEPPQCPF